jgi:hypothetical protein
LAGDVRLIEIYMRVTWESIKSGFRKSVALLVMQPPSSFEDIMRMNWQLLDSSCVDVSGCFLPGFKCFA